LIVAAKDGVDTSSSQANLGHRDNPEHDALHPPARRIDSRNFFEIDARGRYKQQASQRARAAR